MHDWHLIISVFFLAGANWIEDRRHTPLVAALSFRRSLRVWPSDNQRKHSLPVSFSLYFFFFSRSHSVLSVFPFLLHGQAISVSTPSFHPGRLCHLSVSLVFFSVSLLLEDTRCKQSSSQRHTLHTISLAFKGGEYSQLCWKLNSLKPPFPLQQFIVGEVGVFGEASVGCPEVDARGRPLFRVPLQRPHTSASLQPSLLPLTFIFWQGGEKPRKSACLTFSG